MKIRKILFFTLSNIGDVILTLPLLDFLISFRTRTTGLSHHAHLALTEPSFDWYSPLHFWLQNRNLSPLWEWILETGLEISAWQNEQLRIQYFIFPPLVI